MSKVTPGTKAALETLMSQGIDLYFEQEYEAALDVFEKLIVQATKPAVQPLLAQAYRRKGDCLTYMFRFEEALACLEQAIKLLKKNDTTNRCWFLASKASCLNSMGRYHQAVATYQEAISLTTDRDDFEHLKGECDAVFANAFLAEDKKAYQEEVTEKLKSLKEESKNRVAEEFKGKPILEA